MDPNFYQDSITNHVRELPDPELTLESLNLSIHALALCGETGEIANKIKKIVWYRKGSLSETEREDLGDEIGDAMFHISHLATLLNKKLDTIMEEGLTKANNRGTHGFVGGRHEE